MNIGYWRRVKFYLKIVSRWKNSLLPENFRAGQGRGDGPKA